MKKLLFFVFSIMLLWGGYRYFKPIILFKANISSPMPEGIESIRSEELGGAINSPLIISFSAEHKSVEKIINDEGFHRFDKVLADAREEKHEIIYWALNIKSEICRIDNKSREVYIKESIYEGRLAYVSILAVHGSDVCFIKVSVE